jgi:glycosyltransferase involved in cell wall biosynthesis
MKSIKVLLLIKYGRLGASSRLRALQYLPWLADAGIQITTHSLISDDMLQEKYDVGGYSSGELLSGYVKRLKLLVQRHNFDVIWIEKEALPWMPAWLELALLRNVPYVLDYDDAVFHHYDKHRNPWVRRLYGHRLDHLMKTAALVVGGNEYLAQRARDAGAPWVEILPTVIDLERYRCRTDLVNDVTRIVWIGSPSTVGYLQILKEPLKALAKRYDFELRVIGGGTVDMPGVQIKSVDWSEETEVDSILTCDIGIMPLLDSLWERGKCGYKLIQYMACGLPTVASNIGVNAEIVLEGETGFLVSTTQEWFSALDTLLKDPALRVRMGRMGRQRVEHEYCIQQTGTKMAELLHNVADQSLKNNQM